MSFQDTLVDVIDTNLTKKPSTPQFKFTNPLKKTIYINSMQLSFDAYFSEQGSVMILVNGNPILNKKSGELKRLQNLTVPMKNQELLQQKKIEIFAWNGSGETDFVSLGFDIQISEDPNALPSSDTPLSQTMRNNAISDALILFPQIPRADQVDTALIDMKGNKKLRVFLSGTEYESPTVILGGAGVADGDLLTAGTNFNIGVDGLEDEIGRVDYGSIATRKPSCRVTRTNGSTTDWLVQLYRSENGADWFLVGSATFLNNPETKDILGGEVSCRFMKVTVKYTGGDASNNSFHCKEIYDGLLFGGTSALSFEEINIATGQWQEVISSSEFGTVSQGSEIVQEIGDVNTVSISGKTYALPSTQNGFRAKLTTTGAISTGISARRIA